MAEHSAPEGDMELQGVTPSVNCQSRQRDVPPSSHGSSPDHLVFQPSGGFLRSRTRHYPARASEPARQAPPTADRGATSPSATDIQTLFSEIGETLSSPATLRGSIGVARLFSSRASRAPHFYRQGGYRKLVLISFCLMMQLFTVTLGSVGPLALGQIAFLWVLIASVLLAVAAGLTAAVGVLVKECSLLCVTTRGLGEKLVGMSDFLPLCEITSIEYDQLFDEADAGSFDYKVVGSASDGCGFFASQGTNKIPFEDKTSLTQDIDLNIFLNSLELGAGHVVPIPGSVGFTWIKLSNAQYRETVDPLIKAALVRAPDESGYFLSAAGVAVEATRYFRSPRETNATIEEHFPAVTLKIYCSGPNGTQRFEVDYAFALRYPHWPEAAGEWLTRRRFGLDRKTVQLIASRGCYLVHKPCGFDSVPGQNHEFDWRYTFAAAEADLFHYHEDKLALKLCYVILKYLIKTLMKPRGILDTIFDEGYVNLLQRSLNPPEEIPSLRTYHLKTIFLWMAEMETKFDLYNIKGNPSLESIFFEMLNRYIECLEQRFLPNYFISSRNMLASARYAPGDFQNGLALLRKIKRKPVFFITKYFERQFINRKGFIAVCIIMSTVPAAGVFFTSLFPSNS